jgi:hypothetical protein
VPAERYVRSGNSILRPSARILIDEAPPAAQDLFGRGSWRSGRDAPCQKGPVRLAKDDRVHDTFLVTLKLHPETFQLFDRESAVPVVKVLKTDPSVSAAVASGKVTLAWPVCQPRSTAMPPLTASR